ncbi:MAG: PepSY-associated TM helix domain-containing protein [Mangrovibacterium sp.]
MSVLKNKLSALNNWLHLWLGLSSGLIVFIVSLTGCIYVFHTDIKSALEPWRFVDVQDKNFVPPSQLVDTALAYMPGKTPSGLTYEDEAGAAAVGFYYRENGKLEFGVVFLNPYTGEFIRKQERVIHGGFNFFQFILKGHRHLWLPEDIGRRVVGVGTLLFVVLLFTGLVLWWPANWSNANRKKSFSIKWKAGFKRMNLDLHNVPGFYIFIFILIIACTGLIWSFQWFGNSVYYLTSGGQSKEAHSHPHSDTANAISASIDSIPAIDRAYYLTLNHHPNPKRIYMSPHLKEADEAIEVIVYNDRGTFYNHNEYFYDQYSLQLLEVEKYAEASLADKLDHLNYDIHTGAILGLPGKIAAFLVSLIAASLPVTGFLVWWNKRRGRKNQRQSLSTMIDA